MTYCSTSDESWDVYSWVARKCVLYSVWILMSGCTTVLWSKNQTIPIETRQLATKIINGYRCAGTSGAIWAWEWCSHITAIGPKAYSLLCNLHAPVKPAMKKYNDIVKDQASGHSRVVRTSSGRRDCSTVHGRAAEVGRTLQLRRSLEGPICMWIAEEEASNWGRPKSHEGIQGMEMASNNHCQVKVNFRHPAKLNLLQWPQGILIWGLLFSATDVLKVRQNRSHCQDMQKSAIK